MIGNLEQGEHKTLGPVLIAAYLNKTPEPIAIVYLGNGSIKAVPIGELSVWWHFDAAQGKFMPDFTEV